MKATLVVPRLVLGILLGLAGCVRPAGNSLVIATSWPEAERRVVEADFRNWARSHHPELGEPNSIVWIGLWVGEDPGQVASRGEVDVVLGGSASSHRRIGEIGCVARRSTISLAIARGSIGRKPPRSWSDLGEPMARGLLALGDVRHDPVVFAWARARLARGTWDAGYAELVRAAGNARRIGRGPGLALAPIAQDGASMTLAAFSRVAQQDGIAFVRLPESPEWVEGAGLAKRVRNVKFAEAFLEFLRASNPTLPLAKGELEGVVFDTSHAARNPLHEEGSRILVSTPRREGGSQEVPSSAFDALLTDLLGATLVDAHDELESAWGAVVRGGRPPRWERWLVQAPPWPPASITRMKERGEAEELTDLAAQITPEPDVRAWLLKSWERPARPIDAASFDELAHAVDGRLVGEPRFRAWLREEWTEWARQRYRRVERMTGEPTR